MSDESNVEKIETVSKYKKFSDTSFELMERFKQVAPASQKHCLNVAHICDAVSNELKKVRKEMLHCAALYHDVGKMINPQYFVENQIDDINPHDKLEAYISYQLISRHVSDGVAMLFEYGFPDDVIRTVLQHHGNYVMNFFYKKSKKASDESFRYRWNSPDCTEAAILMVVDVIESTSRSQYDNGNLNDAESRLNMINTSIDNLIDDGQLDNIKVGVLKAIRNVMPRELDSLYHKRIEYDEIDDKTILEEKQKK